jgi:hypothetical protein
MQRLEKYDQHEQTFVGQTSTHMHRFQMFQYRIYACVWQAKQVVSFLFILHIKVFFFTRLLTGQVKYSKFFLTYWIWLSNVRTIKFYFSEIELSLILLRLLYFNTRGSCQNIFS